LAKNKFKRIVQINVIFLLILLSIFLINLNKNTYYQFRLDNSNSFHYSSQIDLNQIWVKMWGGYDYDKSYDVVSLGNYVYIVGETGSYGNGQLDAFVAKYSRAGELIWNITWGGKDWDGASAVYGSNGAIYLTGYTRYYNSSNTDVFLLKVAENGTIIWNRIWGGPNIDEGTDLIVVGSNVYIVGDTTSWGNGGHDCLILKYDINGTFIWNITWGGVNDDIAYGIASDLSYLYVSGVTESFGAGTWDCLIVKFYLNGTQIWNKTWGGVYTDLGRCIFYSNSYLYITGGTSSYGSGASDIFILKYDINGNLTWNRFWGGTGDDLGSKIIIMNYSLYIVGTYENPKSGNYDAVLLKYNLDGTSIWNYTWNNGNLDWGFGIWALNSKIYICGFSQIINQANNFDSFLIKLGVELIPPILNLVSPSITTSPTIKLKWNKIYAATKYKIYRANYPILNITGMQPIVQTENTNYIDTLTIYDTYYYVVVSTNGTHDSNISNCVNVSYIEKIPGPQLILLSNSLTFQPEVLLNWSEVNDTLYYIIYRSTAPIENVDGINPIAIVLNTSYKENLSSLGIYYYAVVAVTTYTNSSVSNNVMVIFLFTSDGFKFFIGYLVIFIILLSSILGWYYIEKRNLRIKMESKKKRISKSKLKN